MKVIIFDMYGVIMKAPEGDLIPFIKKQFPDVTDEFVNNLWKEAAFGRSTSHEFFEGIGYKENIDEIEVEYLDSVEIDEEFLIL